MLSYGYAKEDDKKYILILMELCDGGTLIDLLNKYSGKMNESQILFILNDICSAISHMHSQAPPISHRDIKVENILLHNKRFKLCDFGSSSTDVLEYRYNHN
jgi:AP2-associated kinase